MWAGSRAAAGYTAPPAPPPPPGTLVHGQPFTASGFSGAGTKSRAVAPFLVDQGLATTGTLDPVWSGAVPSTSQLTNPTGNLVNRDVGFAPTGATIGAPHPYVPRIQAGCAGTLSGAPDAYSGINTGPAINFTRPVGDYVLYSKMEYRADPNWTFGLSGFVDDNYKTYNFGSVGIPFPGNNQYDYLGYVNFGNTLNNTTPPWLCGTDSPHDITAGLANPDANGNNSPYGHMLFPQNPANGWINEVLERYNTSSTTLAGGGQINVWDNCVNFMAERYGKPYQGWTDRFSGPSGRTFLFGGFQRDCGPLAQNNWRYFADLYFDITAGGMSPGAHVARVEVGNNPVYNSCTIRELGIPSAWADGSITFEFRKGKLTGGSTGYIFVQPEQGAVISAGSATISVSP